MAFVPVADTAHVLIRGSDVGNAAYNDLYFTQAGGWSPLNLTDVATAIRDWWEASVLPSLSDQYTLIDVVATDISTQFGFQATVSSGGVGGVATEQAPNAIAACISFRTGIRGRSFRGRNYIPAIPNAAIDVNILDAGFLTVMQTSYAELLPGGGIFPGGVPLWVVVSRFSGVDPVTHDPIPRVAGITTQIVSVGFSDNIVDSMDTRKPGRGS